MAIGIDNTQQTFNGSTVTSFTYSYTTGGSDRLLIVQLYWQNSRTVSTITYNGVAMTAVVSPLDTGGGERHGMWYLVNPASGANNLSVTFSGTTPYVALLSSYTGIDQASPIGATRTETGLETGTSYSEALTTTTNDSWIVWGTREYAGRTISAGADTTLLQREATIYGMIQARSTSGAAAGSRTLTLTASASGNWFSDILAEIKPATVVANNNGFMAFF
jgi:hypothetical protein